MPIAHTARFMQTFHTGRTTAQRTAASQTEAPTDHIDTDPAAVAFVKGQRYAKVAAPTANPAHLTDVKGWSVNFGAGMLTEKQASFLISLATTKQIADGLDEALKIRLEQGLAKAAASQIIDSLMKLPNKPIERKPLAEVAVKTETEVPAGRYALRTDGVVKFYRLDRPTEGRWAGYVFLKLQASDDLWSIRNHTERDRILAEIAKDVLAAERLYGVELGKCSRCGRTLTDETSRAYGIGPDCRTKR